VVADDGDKTLDLAILGVTDWLPSSPRKIWVWDRDLFSSSSIQSIQKWIEWLWSIEMIADILSIYLYVTERFPLTDYAFRFRAVLSILYHFGEPALRWSIATSPIPLKNVMSGYRHSQYFNRHWPKALSKIHIAHHLNSAFCCFIWIPRRFELDYVEWWGLAFSLAWWVDFLRIERILTKSARVEVISRESPIGAERRWATRTKCNSPRKPRINESRNQIFPGWSNDSCLKFRLWWPEMRRQYRNKSW
jgi:hypothetical protein